MSLICTAAALILVLCLSDKPSANPLSLILDSLLFVMIIGLVVISLWS